MIRRPALFFVLAACSTAAVPPDPPACTDDDDCPEGEVCSREQGLCVDGREVPPIEILGFDIQEVGGGNAQYRVEVDGCDEEVEVFTGERREIEARRNSLSQFITLKVFSREPADIENPTVEELLPARIQLSQPSRFARSPTPISRSVDHPQVQAEGVISDSQLRWPRYHPENDLPPHYRDNGFILWKTTPTRASPEAELTPASRYHMLVPPPVFSNRPCEVDQDCCPEGSPDCSVPSGTCVDTEWAAGCRPVGAPEYLFRYIYDDACNRKLRGRVIRVDDQLAQTGTVANASVSLRHADLPDEPRLGLAALERLAPSERPRRCEDDTQCIEGDQFCDVETGQCLLALDGLDAASGVSIDDSGAFQAPVFTYCEGPTDVPNRGFTATVRSGASGTMSTSSLAISYAFEVRFDPIADAKPDMNLQKPLCVPDVGPLRNLALVPSGAPVELLSGPELQYRCCDISCLPATQEDAMSMPPPSDVEQCPNSQGSSPAVVRLSSELTISDERRSAWEDEDSSCERPIFGPDNLLGNIRNDMSCSPETLRCETDIIVGRDEARTYQVRIEMPDGALLASRTETIELRDGELDPIEIELEPRVLVRGRVTLGPELCDPDLEEDCGSAGALVLAERLAMPGVTEGNTPGPYFHEVSTFYDPVEQAQGSYVLPLDPGVYVITALPLSGTSGGPATLKLLDIRDRAPGQVVERDFQLDPGTLVTIDVSSFDRRSQVTPLDRGSWRFGTALEHPGYDRPVDLNAVDECLISSQEGSSDAQGCRIRRLTSSSSLALTQVGKVRFTARGLPEGVTAQDCR